MKDFRNFNNMVQGDTAPAGTMVKTFMANVFAYMTGALAITGIIAYAFGTSPALLNYLINPETGGMSIFGYVVMFAPLLMVFGMSMAFNRLSSFVLMMLFIVFSILMGMSMSFIFLAYTGSSIAATFAISSGTFGVMALLGYTTNTDLTKFGSILRMALIGIIIAMVVNIFIGSEAIEFIISIAGVLIFTGLTAYDVQKLKRIGSGVEYDTQESSNKLAIMGSLTLYLDFINLFMFLLRFLGDRK